MINKQVFVVLGMHRSGTSALSGELHHQGVFFGENFIDDIETVNEKGFYEHRELVDINECILDELGAAWYDCFDVYAQVNQGWRPSEKIINRIKQFLVSDEFSDHQLIGIKDPRLCLLYPIWQEQIKIAGLTAHVVMVNRDVSCVAASLARRDDMVHMHSALLWNYYTISAAMAANQSNGYWIETEGMFSNPLLEISRMLAWFDIDLNVQTAKFIDPKIPKSIANPMNCDLSRRILDASSPLLDVDWLQEMQSFSDRYLSQREFIRAILDSFKLINDANIKAINNGENYSHALCVINSKDEAIEYRDNIIVAKDAFIAEKDQFIAEKDQFIAEKDQFIAEKDQLIAENSIAIENLENEKNLLVEKINHYENIFGIRLLRKIKRRIKVIL
ncbi:sulfotransferase family protein [Enterovibrio calviensis]|uniref:sulfotransferase family protein n=1 Tax=Enterovibrio calviensis TaxID=91359 RepID=UPI00048361D4|nr:sulfotransferase family protein [Enterovibrio calviensis]